MRTILFIILGLTFTLNAQVKGNKQIETRTFNFENVKTIKTNLYAKITVDPSAKAGLTITTDSNLFRFIDTEIIDGTINLEQLKWIQPSQNIIIKMGTPNLERFEQGTHDTSKIINANLENLSVLATIGKVIIEGRITTLQLGVELGAIDASKTEAKDVYANIWSRGTVKVNATDILQAEVSNDGKLIYISEPKSKKINTKKGGLVYKDSDKPKANSDLKWIRFKIKNNAANRNHFVVIGPKKDGSSFSYGFPMMPNAIRKENWSVGTQLYQKNSLGFRKLIKTITKADEGRTISLFGI